MKHFTRYPASGHSACGNGQNGLILVEVLIAGLILVLGIGALATTQQTALKTFTNAEISSLLVDIHGSIVDRLRLHPDAARNGAFNIELLGESGNRSGKPSPEEPSLLQDILITLDNTGARRYLKVRCESSHSSHCQVCVGLSGSAIGSYRSGQDEPPINKLCSQQRIL